MMANNKQHYAYDLEYSHIMKEIKTPVSICYSRNSNKEKSIKIDALWDTGATHSILSPKIAKELVLSPVDNLYVGGINTEVSSDVVIVTITLPNGMTLSDRRFYVCNIPGVEVIIGMDIISMGDFAITNARGKTMFSFVIPTLNNTISFSDMVNNKNAHE